MWQIAYFNKRRVKEGKVKESIERRIGGIYIGKALR